MNGKLKRYIRILLNVNKSNTRIHINYMRFLWCNIRLLEYQEIVKNWKNVQIESENLDILSIFSQFLLFSVSISSLLVYSFLKSSTTTKNCWVYCVSHENIAFFRIFGKVAAISKNSCPNLNHFPYLQTFSICLENCSTFEDIFQQILLWNGKFRAKKKWFFFRKFQVHSIYFILFNGNFLFARP